jgi:hypothetical protein
MTTRKILAVAALSLLAAVGAQAETYDGVLTVRSTLSRADAQGQAVAAARAGNIYGDTYGSGVLAANSTVDRASVRAEAVAAAHNPLQSLDRRAFYRDQVPVAYLKPRVSFTQQASR